MNPILITIIQGDYGYDLNFTLKDALEIVVNLTGSVLTFISQSVPDGVINFTNPMIIVGSPLLGTCKYTVQQNDFLTSGTFNGQITVNYGSGTEIISFSTITLEVVPRLPQ